MRTETGQILDVLSKWGGGHRPTEKQLVFLLLDHREALYGGQAGGGKSDALLMGQVLAATQHPGYAGLILRRTYRDLALPGALMDRAHEWWGGTAARWSEQDKTWTFPIGGTITFGYLEHEKQKYRYQSSEFQGISFDELTQFPNTSYTYMFSRLRRTTGIRYKPRMRSGTNPGGEGHAWVYERFIVGRFDNVQQERVFVPAGLFDNPHVNAEEYVQALEELDDVTKEQLLHGRWVTDPNRKAYMREWWRGRNRFLSDSRQYRASVIGRYLSFDTALKDEEQNDYSACVVVEMLADYRVAIRYVWRDKVPFTDLISAIEDLAGEWNQDGKLTKVIIEDKVSGTSAYQTLTRAAPDWLASRLVAFSPKTDKVSRAKQAAVWAKRGMVLLPHPGQGEGWLPDFENEIFEFPDVVFDDQTDALSQAVIYLENYISVGWHAVRAKAKQQEEEMGIIG